MSIIKALVSHIKNLGFKTTWCKTFHSYKRATFTYKMIIANPCKFFYGVNDYVATYDVKCNCGCTYEQSFLMLGKSEYFPTGSADICEAKEKAKSMTRKGLVGK